MNEQINDKPEIRQFLPCLSLLAGETHIKGANGEDIEPLHELCLKFIYGAAIPSNGQKQEIKTEIQSYIDKIENADAKQMNTILLQYAIEDPYRSYTDIKKSYPAWVNEYLLFIWDSGARLNEDLFKKIDPGSHELHTSIIEQGTADYVFYLISKQ
jgi:hypothetical protein